MLFILFNSAFTIFMFHNLCFKFSQFSMFSQHRDFFIEMRLKNKHHYQLFEMIEIKIEKSSKQKKIQKMIE